MSEHGTGAEPAGAYEEHLRRQAQELRHLKVQRGDPSLRRIQTRAKELFGDRVPLPIATQHAAFNGRYVSLDKLIILVRTLMSWDPYGQPCPAPERTAPELTHWHEQWRTIAELRNHQRRPAPAHPPATPPASKTAAAAGADDAQQRPLRQTAPPDAPPTGASSPTATAPAHPPSPGGRITATRSISHSRRVLAALGLAGTLILALETSGPRLCTTAHSTSTHEATRTGQTQPAGYRLLPARAQQRPGAPAPALCIHTLNHACPADFPSPTPSFDIAPPTTPAPTPDLSSGSSSSLTPTPNPTRQQAACT